jgi:hypothetical protein
MKRAAVVKRRRTDPLRGPLVWVPNCPLCKGSHWTPDQPTGTCPRKRGTYTIRPTP